jgi:tetratricopeptide (TPR) repeat protein
MRQFFTTFLLSLLSLFPGIAQQETDFKEVFLTAEMYFNYDEYNEALPLYLKLKRNFPENDNYNYKIGVCLLNNPYEKEKSINYLELAVNNIKTKSKDHNFKETAAPPEALFYLGTAYRINNNLAKAKEFYNRFLNEMDSDVYDAELVKEQLAACDVAERLMKKPIDFDVENIGQPLNTVFADKRPVLSGDDTKIVFISELRFYDAIFYSEKIDGIWQNPRNIVPELGVDGDVYPTCLSYNGTELFLYRNDEFIGNLYHSRLVNGIWTPLKKLNNNINTKYWESHASISKDGKHFTFPVTEKEGLAVWIFTNLLNRAMVNGARPLIWALSLIQSIMMIVLL